MLHGQVVANILALMILLFCWKWKVGGRLSLVLLFLWAGLYNFWAAFLSPEQYLAYARLASVTWYQKFILGFFSEHTTAIVALIALGQLAAAVLMSLRGTAVYLGLAGAIISLVAIAPLGSGSAFPSTLIAASGALLLLQYDYYSTLGGELRNALKHHQVTP
jgi:hypothetical protein